MAKQLVSETTQKLLELLAEVPHSNYERSETPVRAAQKIIEKYSWMAGGISGAMAIPPGPLGMLTVLPDLVAVWRLQAQMVADIAAVYGKSSYLTKETLVYCLFQEGSGSLLRDVIVRAGDRIVLRKTTLRIFENILEKVGLRLSRRVLGGSIARWIPIAGAVTVGWYSRHDTQNVGYAAMDFFSRSIQFENEVPKS